MVTFLGEGLDVAQQGEAIGAKAASVATYLGGSGLRASGLVLAASAARYAKALHLKDALQDAAFTPQERGRAGRGEIVDSAVLQGGTGS